MTVYKEQISLNSHGTTPTYLDITPQVKEAIKNSGIKSGTCTVISPHTTCSVFFEEFVHDYNEAGDEFLQEDLNNVLERSFQIRILKISTFIREKNIMRLWRHGRTLQNIFRTGTEKPSGTATHI